MGQPASSSRIGAEIASRAQLKVRVCYGELPGVIPPPPAAGGTPRAERPALVGSGASGR